MKNKTILQACVETRILKIYGSKQKFCKAVGIDPRDYTSKLRTMQSKVNWLNKFLESIDHGVDIVETKEETHG